MAREGLLADLLATGATVSEPTCGSCAGIGHVPAAGTKSLRAFNRNFPGRSGVKGDEVYLCSSVVAAASALTGVITDPRTLGAEPAVTLPAKFAASVAGFVRARRSGRGRARARTSSRCRWASRWPRRWRRRCCSSSATRSPPTTSRPPAPPCWCSARTSRPSPSTASSTSIPEFVARAKAAGRGMIVGGETYGQGSSREAAAMGPMFLGVRAVHRQIVRADPPGEPDQLGRGAAHLRRSADCGRHRARRPAASAGLRAALAAGERREGREHADGCPLHGLVRSHAARARHSPGRRHPRAHTKGEQA